MSLPTLTIDELRRWMDENHLPDNWWVCNRIRIHGPMTLEAIDREYLNAGCRPYVVHTAYTENHPWTEIVPDPSQIKKTNRLFRPHAATALGKCKNLKNTPQVPDEGVSVPEKQ